MEQKCEIQPWRKTHCTKNETEQKIMELTENLKTKLKYLRPKTPQNLSTNGFNGTGTERIMIAITISYKFHLAVWDCGTSTSFENNLQPYSTLLELYVSHFPDNYWRLSLLKR